MDLGASHAGGSSGAARLVTEIVYDAYGRVLARADRAGTTPPDLRLGHKGLFFDRLDTGVADPGTNADTRRLEAGSTLIGFNRNRSLHTQWGRWLQRDPNATGMVVCSSMNFHDRLSRPRVGTANLKEHAGDGSNVFLYVGSSPFRHSDPAGLFIGLAGQAAVMGASAWLNASGTLEDAANGLIIGFGLNLMLEDYQFWQDFDADWAGDWSQSDLFYSTSTAWEMFAPKDSDGEGGADFAVAGRWKGRQNWLKNAAKGGRYFGAAFKRPPAAAIRKAMDKVKKNLKAENAIRGDPGDFSSPQWGASQGANAGVGFRVDPPHSGHKPGSPGSGWHINWWNNNTGKSGAEPIEF